MSDTPRAVRGESDPRERIACPLCGRESRHAFRKKVRDYYRCGTCQMLSVPEQQHPSEITERRRYLEHNNSEDQAGYVSFLEPARRAVLECTPSGSRILDLGCGPVPVLAAHLRRSGFRVHSFDPLFHPDPVLSGPYGCIVATEVFEHFRRPGPEIASTLGLMSAGSSLVVMTLLIPDAGPRSDWWYLNDVSHICFYQRSTFEWIAAAHGLRVTHCDGERLVVLRK